MREVSPFMVYSMLFWSVSGPLFGDFSLRIREVIRLVDENVCCSPRLKSASSLAVVLPCNFHAGSNVVDLGVLCLWSVRSLWLFCSQTNGCFPLSL